MVLLVWPAVAGRMKKTPIHNREKSARIWTSTGSPAIQGAVLALLFTSMAKVHIPHLDEEEAEPTPAPSSSATPHRRRSVLRILLEVVLITAGVFLALAGESWREA